MVFESERHMQKFNNTADQLSLLVGSSINTTISTLQLSTYVYICVPAVIEISHTSQIPRQNKA